MTLPLTFPKCFLMMTSIFAEIKICLAHNFECPVTAGRKFKIILDATQAMAIRYSITKDKAFCAYCICFGGTKNIPGASSYSSNLSPFVSCGFSNWKKATGKDNYIDHHMLSEAHHRRNGLLFS